MTTRETLLKLRSAILQCDTVKTLMDDIETNSRCVTFHDYYFEDLSHLRDKLDTSYQLLLEDLKTEIRCETTDDIQKEG